MLQEGRDDLPSLLFALLSCMQAGIISLNALNADGGCTAAFGVLPPVQKAAV